MWLLRRILEVVYFRVIVALFVICAVVFLIYSGLGVFLFIDGPGLDVRFFGLAVVVMALGYGYFAWQLAKVRIEAIAQE